MYLIKKVYSITNDKMLQYFIHGLEPIISHKVLKEILKLSKRPVYLLGIFYILLLWLVVLVHLAS